MTHLPETALHRIWERHDLLAAPLRTTDGRAVSIMHAGMSNPDSGPDFLGAVVRIGATTFRGDVEIHITPAGWHLHHHDRDPRYNRVILHVTGRDPADAPPARTAAGRLLPLLVLPCSDTLPPSTVPERTRVIAACAARLRQYRDPHNALARLGWSRIRRKISRFEQRLHQLTAGRHGITAEPGSPPCAPQWEQLVYEAVMESMGYARNGAAFLLLARTVTLRHLITAGRNDPERIMGILFGAARLLPDPASLADTDAAACVRTLHRHWRTWQAVTAQPPIHEVEWVFFRLRPANFPTARIAAMAHILPLLFAPGVLCTLLHDTGTRMTRPSAHVRQLRQIMTISPEGYWSHHLHFRDRRKEHGVRMGRDRIGIIMLNALLPIALLHARSSKDRHLFRRLHTLMRHVPPPHEPRIIREIRERALGKTNRLGAVEQMGMVELLARTREDTRSRKSEE